MSHRRLRLTVSFLLTVLAAVGLYASPALARMEKIDKGEGVVDIVAERTRGVRNRRARRRGGCYGVSAREGCEQLVIQVRACMEAEHLVIGVLSGVSILARGCFPCRRFAYGPAMPAAAAGLPSR